MEGSFLSPPAKRSYTATMQDNNAAAATNGGASKRRSKPPPPPLSVPSGHAALRLLCPVTKIGGVIGKSGSIVKLVRQETGAKIRIEEAFTACDERVVLIVAPENPKKVVVLRGADGTAAGVEEEVSPLQEALLKVFERVLDVEAETQGIFPPTGGVVSCRLLAEASQGGAVIGKGGKVVEKIKKETGSKIRVLTDQLPACASQGDEIIQITGDAISVKKALVAVSRLLQDNAPTDKGPINRSRPAGTDPHGTFPETHVEVPHRSSYLPPLLGDSADYGSRGRPLPKEVDRMSTLDPKKQQEVTFRLVCSNDSVGGVIGKGGAIVRALQSDTGANISVASSVAEADDRVITVSAMESPDSPYSPAQNALVRVFTRSVEAAIEKGLDTASNKNGSVSARLLVPANQVGCLMGKGGTIISEMRRLTGTAIRIIAGDKIPKWTSEDDEVVQILGELENVHDALLHITGRLRDNIFPNKMLNSVGAGDYYSSTFPEISHYGREREPTSPGVYPPVRFSRNMDRQTTLTHSMDHLGLSHGYDRPPSPQPWMSHSQPFGGVIPRNPDVGRGLTTLRGGFGSGGKSAIVTNTTVEIAVPQQIIGSVYGEKGNNLNRLRQISGAKVKIHDPRPGTSETIFIISGTPDQTQAAQSLLQAFILSGQSSPEHRSRLL